MAGTDAFVEAPSPTLDLETRKAIQRLRKLLVVNPTECHLFTRSLPGGVERWLSDRYVMVKVQGVGFTNLATVAFPDGAYKLSAGKGLVPTDMLVSDTAGLLQSIESKQGDWYPITRTDWSLADSEAKLMLAYANVWGGLTVPPEERGWIRTPLAINEGIWNAFVAAYPDREVTFEYRAGDPYAVVTYETTDEDGKPGRYAPETVAYIAAAHFPQGNEVARKIVDAL